MIRVFLRQQVPLFWKRLIQRQNKYMEKSGQPLEGGNGWFLSGLQGRRTWTIGTHGDGDEVFQGQAGSWAGWYSSETPLSLSVGPTGSCSIMSSIKKTLQDIMLFPSFMPKFANNSSWGLSHPVENQGRTLLQTWTCGNFSNLQCGPGAAADHVLGHSQGPDGKLEHGGPKRLSKERWVCAFGAAIWQMEVWSHCNLVFR